MFAAVLIALVHFSYHMNRLKLLSWHKATISKSWHPFYFSHYFPGLHNSWYYEASAQNTNSYIYSWLQVGHFSLRFVLQIHKTGLKLNGTLEHTYSSEYIQITIFYICKQIFLFAYKTLYRVFTNICEKLSTKRWFKSFFIFILLYKLLEL